MRVFRAEKLNLQISTAMAKQFYSKKDKISYTINLINLILKLDTKNVDCGKLSSSVSYKVDFLVVKNLLKSQTWPMPITTIITDSPMDQYDTRSFSNSAKFLPAISRFR